MRRARFLAALAAVGLAAPALRASSEFAPAELDPGAARSVPQDGGVGEAPGEAGEPGEESELDRLLRLAREGAPVVRPQAAEQLARLGPEAAARVRAEAGETSADLARLGRELVAVLGRFEDPALRARAWSALGDPDFPWRPQAAQTLAETALDDEAARFVALLSDPLAAVRAAGVDALRGLDARERAAAIEALLSDPDDRVRRVAAAALDAWGERWALHWLVEDLRRTDRFFQLRTGMTARFDAARLLEERLGEELDLAPASEPTEPDAAAAIERVAARVREVAGAPRELPRVARAAEIQGEPVLGLEVRSCRRGEHFLLWTAEDELWIGTGNPLVAELPAGTTARLREAARAMAAELGPRGAWGEPGCDLEQLHLVDPESGRVQTYRVSKGPDPEPDLRPDALDALLSRMVATLPERADGEALRATVADALAAVGGPPGDSSGPDAE